MSSISDLLQSIDNNMAQYSNMPNEEIDNRTELQHTAHSIKDVMDALKATGYGSILTELI